MNRLALSPAELSHFLQILHRTPKLAVAGRHALARLLASAYRVEAAAGESLCRAGEKAPAVMLLLDGEYDYDGLVHVDLGFAGRSLIGMHEVVHDLPFAGTITARSPAQWLAVPAEDVRSLWERWPPFRAAARTMIPTVGAELGHRAAVVRFESHLPGAPVPLLMNLLGRTVAASFPDKVLVVSRARSGEAPSPRQISQPGPGTVFHVAADEAWIQANREQYDYVFVEPDGAANGHVEIIARLCPPGVPTKRLETESPWVLETMIVQPGDAAPTSGARALTLMNANDQPPAATRVCPLHLDLARLRQVAQSWSDTSDLGSIEPRVRAGVAAWARAITGRRTGVAVGGGGAFAMVSVYAIQEILRRGVPIDVITGTSGGSMVGGYYAALGTAGLDKLVEQGDSGQLDRTVMASWVYGAAIERLFARTLGDPLIEHLTFARFHPAMSALAAGEGVIAVAGPLALGMRASGAATPVFPATITGGERLVDGVYTNNLPVQALSLVQHSASLTLGLNVYPPSRLPLAGWMPESVSQLLASVGVINRGLTFVTAFNLQAAVSSQVEGDFASVRYNLTTDYDAPYLHLGDFRDASKIVAQAAQDEALGRAIDEYVRLWEVLRDRGAPAAQQPR